MFINNYPVGTLVTAIGQQVEGILFIADDNSNLEPVGIAAGMPWCRTRLWIARSTESEAATGLSTSIRLGRDGGRVEQGGREIVTGPFNQECAASHYFCFLPGQDKTPLESQVELFANHFARHTQPYNRIWIACINADCPDESGFTPTLESFIRGRLKTNVGCLYQKNIRDLIFSVASGAASRAEHLE